MIDADVYSKEEYKTAWKNLIQGIPIAPLSKPLILDSWRRCQKMNVDPWQKTAAKVLNKDILQTIRESNKLFLDVSMPTLENLYRFVERSGFVVALSDNNGCLIEVFGDDQVQNLVQQGNWVPGAVWDESSAGTNIIGTSLCLDQPIALIGYQHFCRCSHRYQGAGAPIHDSQGKIIGAISLAGSIDKSHPHTLGMIVAAAHAIEIQFEMKKAWHACDLADQHKSIIVNSIYEGLLVTDDNGVITLVNRRIQEILNVPEEKLLGVNIKSIFSESFMGLMERKQGQVIDFHEEIALENHKMRCTISSQPIITNGHLSGIVVVINEFTRTKKLLSKLFVNDARFTFDCIIGQNSKFCETLNFAKVVANKESNVLLLGESGTGKDVFAQAIHNASPRRRGPFVAVNCGAIPKELIGSELFGYSEGAFTGAKKGGKMGKFELADGGTLFLDEIGEMPAEQQKVLLRVLEDRRINRLGGQDLIPINVRIIAATNTDLEHAVREGVFRQDLFYRLNVFAIRMLPLRERREDIKLLTNVFLKKLSQEMGSARVELSENVWDLLFNYNWPGNVRELQNSIERAMILSEGKYITCELFDFYNKNKPKYDIRMSNLIKSTLQNYETDILIKILEQNQWNISKASIQLGVSRTTLYRKMGIHGIRIPEKYEHRFNP